MTFEIYYIQENKKQEVVHSELLTTADAPAGVISFAEPWLEAHGYSLSCREWIQYRMRLEEINEKIVRDSATFKIGRYIASQDRFIHCLKIDMIGETQEEEEPVPTPDVPEPEPTPEPSGDEPETDDDDQIIWPDDITPDPEEGETEPEPEEES